MPRGVGPVGMSNAGRFTGGATTTVRYLISGITRDSSGVALAGVTVEIFETVASIYRGFTISDSSGAYAIEVSGDRGLTFFAQASKAGAPDVAGTTVNTLVAS